MKISIPTPCHEDWDKMIMTPVSGTFEYYNQSDEWVATIDYGNGDCDKWAIKTWDVGFFPENLKLKKKSKNINLSKKLIKTNFLITTPSFRIFKN